MKFIKTVVAGIIFFFYLSVLAQTRSVLPSKLADRTRGAWVDSNNEIVLFITKDYLVIHNELYYYLDILAERRKTFFTCVDKEGAKYINIDRLSETKIILDEGEKITTLSKISGELANTIPESLVDSWYVGHSKIELQKANVLYGSTLFKIDAVLTVNQTNFLIIIYHKGTYSLLYNFLNKNGHFLNTDIEQNLVFKKVSFFKKYKKRLITILVLLLILIVYYTFKMRIKITKKKEELKRAMIEMQLKSIRSQMNPHFLFNALSAIQNLINKNDSVKANHYLTQFAQLMRLTLDKSEKGVVFLEDELKSIEKYLELEKLRFHFDYSIHIDKDIDLLQTEIPAMLIQPYVENAIIHGLNQKQGEKQLTLVFKHVENGLIFVIEDNGIGIEASKSQKQSLGIERTSYGLKLAQDRIQLIRDSYNTNVKIKITDISKIDPTKTGTRVEIRLPIKYEL